MILSDALKKIIADPEDLTQLPTIIERVAQLEASELEQRVPGTNSNRWGRHKNGRTARRRTNIRRRT